MGDLGAAALWFGLIVALYATAGAAVGALTGHTPRARRWIASARNGVLALAGLLTVAVASMVYALFTHDFSIAYVARNNSLHTPLLYTLTGLWGGQAGSILFWTWILSLYSALFVVRQHNREPVLVSTATTILMAIATFFLFVLTTVENPFTRLFPPPADGRGLNPLLEDPGMLIHPPLLYLGYVGFAVPYAVAMASLLTGRSEIRWIQWTRPWTLFAWAALGAGMVFGGWWAYRTLGWGGYWGWDPVENSALMPWLVGTAYIHSVIIQERRGMLAAWSVALIILTFSLAILGTFLTRTGVVVSVHSFAQSAIGPYFLAFLGALILGSFGLFLRRLDDLRSPADLDSLASRESAFLLNNVIFLAMAFAVLLGTLFPILTEAVRGVRIMVGPPYFNQVTTPMGLLLILLMGIGPLLAWRRTSLEELLIKLRWPVASGLIMAMALAIVLRRPLVVLALAVMSFTFGTTIQEFHGAAAGRSRITGEPYSRALWRSLWRRRRRYGGYLVHLAVLVMAVGIVFSSAYVTERQDTLTPGSPLRVGRYTIVHQGLQQQQDSTGQVTAASLTVSAEGREHFVLAPVRRYYSSYQQSVSRPAILSSWREDLYVVLVGFFPSGEATFRIWINPLVRWIWMGGFLFLLGAGVAAWPEGRSVAKAWQRSPLQTKASDKDSP